ncbi:Mpp10 protein [Meredithblackwellia eburnea MCA 4105]
MVSDPASKETLVLKVNGKVSKPALNEAQEEENDLLDLAEAITASAHALAPGKLDSELALRAQKVVKTSFDRALKSESIAFQHLSALLLSLQPSSAPKTRSASAATPNGDDTAPTHVALTPLGELTTEGMEPDMIWEQMEMRNGSVVELLDNMFGGGENEDGASDQEGGSDEEGLEDEEEDESEEDSEEEENSDEEEDGDGDGYEEGELYEAELGPAGGDSEESEEGEDPMLDQTAGLTLETFDKPGSGRPQRRAPGPRSAVDDDFFSLHDFHVAADEGEYEMMKALRGEAGSDDEEDDGIDLFAPVGDLGDDDEEQDEEDLDGAGVMYKDFFDPPPRPLGKGKGKGKAKEEETFKSKKGKRKEAEAELISVDVDGKRKVRFSDAVKVKTIAARGSEFDKLVAKVGWEKAVQQIEEQESGLVGGSDGSEDKEEEEDGNGVDEMDSNMFDSEEGSEEEEEEDVEMDDEEEDSGSDGGLEEGFETIERLKTSLFDDEEEGSDEDSSPASKLTKHERRLMALSSQIAQLEAENVGPKDWATRGEANTRDRPVNSLLEEDLEFERAGKVVPVITEETTKTIEDLIKKRILDNQFDDVVRQRAVDPNAFLPSRFMEIQDTRSGKSLAEIYEEDYTVAREKDAGREVVHELDKDLEKKHTEIEDLFEDLSAKLDALSNARFTPKPPKASITTVSNVAAVSMESALPTTTSTSNLLAPEEIFVTDPTNEDRSEFTPSQKKQARQKRRKARASMAKSAEKFSKGVKGDKERATKQLVGTKGVTVLGKGGKVEKGTKRKRGADDEGGRSGVSLKL